MLVISEMIVTGNVLLPVNSSYPVNSFETTNW